MHGQKARPDPVMQKARPDPVMRMRADPNGSVSEAIKMAGRLASDYFCKPDDLRD
jgi:hypothetical protein